MAKVSTSCTWYFTRGVSWDEPDREVVGEIPLIDQQSSFYLIQL